jgi:hypothetical protein
LNTRQIKRSARALPLEELINLEAWLHRFIRRTKAKTRKVAANGWREVLEEQIIDKKTYRLVKVHCSKKGCKCASGGGHGPYWYAYWSEKGRTRSMYIGKKLPQQESQDADKEVLQVK